MNERRITVLGWAGLEYSGGGGGGNGIISCSLAFHIILFFTEKSKFVVGRYNTYPNF